MGKYSVSKSLTVGQIATQSLWNNEFIHTNSESLYDESLVSKGIMTVSNLFDNEGELKNWETVSQEFSLNSIHFLTISYLGGLFPPPPPTQRPFSFVTAERLELGS